MAGCVTKDCLFPEDLTDRFVERGLIRRNDDVGLYSNEKVYLFFVYMGRISKKK